RSSDLVAHDRGRVATRRDRGTHARDARRAHRIMKRRDEPVPLSEAIASVSRDLGMPPPDVFETLNAGWRDIVGAAIADHAQVRSVRDGECTIAVDGPAWATQLRYG